MADTIPCGAIIVKTKNSTYRLGASDEEMARTISRDEKPLYFTKCEILSLKVGSSMVLTAYTDGKHGNWYTTKVLSIEPQ